MGHLMGRSLGASRIYFFFYVFRIYVAQVAVLNQLVSEDNVSLSVTGVPISQMGDRGSIRN